MNHPQRLAATLTTALALAVCAAAPAGAGQPAVFPLQVEAIAEAYAAQDAAAARRGPRNVRIVRDLYRAFAEGDLDTILAIIHPDVVWIESEGIPYGGTFIGRDEVFEGVFAKIAAEWTGFTAVVDEFIYTTDQRVITLGRDSGTFNATGKSMTAPTASIWTLNSKGQVIRFVQYIDTLAVVNATIP